MQAGDLEITVQETTDVPLREEYLNATLAGAAQVTLGPDETLSQYVDGCRARIFTINPYLLSSSPSLR